MDEIEIYGARENNLKNINLSIPRNKLIVFTGVSGSGKSSLAFNTIFAEGQRRYIETLSMYARNFMKNIERPNVDKINGLSPVIATEQKTINKNPRSTVGTVTEIYDFLRVLFARISDGYSINTGEKMIKYTTDEITELIVNLFYKKKIYILSPLVRSRKGNYTKLFEKYLKKGFKNFRINGKIIQLTSPITLDRFKNHNIELIINKFIIDKKTLSEKIIESIKLGLNLGKGMLIIINYKTQKIHFFSKNLICPSTGISYADPEPNLFSFNSPEGYCATCKGIGEIEKVNLDKLIVNKELSIYNAITIFSNTKLKNDILPYIEKILKINDYKLYTPFNELSEKTKNEILYGIKKKIKVNLISAQISKEIFIDFQGIIPYLESINQSFNKNSKTSNQETNTNRIKKYFSLYTCPNCNGNRLKKESYQFKILEKNITEISCLPLYEFKVWISDIINFLKKRQKIIAETIIPEILVRVNFLIEVGLEYLTINRSIKTLSGGEAQRIRLAVQIGSQLVNILHILDEPSIGLHQRDNMKLIQSLKKLRDIGNTVIVVEHDKDMILNSDYIIDIGPLAGKKGGKIVWSGKSKEIQNAKTLTSDYINKIKSIVAPKINRKGNGNNLILEGCSGHNLKNITLRIPLGKLVGISGVSGSGKSSLINKTLSPILNNFFYKNQITPLPYKNIKGLEFLDKLVEVNQSPIGRTPRSNPATYTGIFTEIRNLFASLTESKIRGYLSGRFSFNVKGGRCEICKGSGLKIIEMNFLPDVYTNCESCNGKRFNRETLEVKYKGKSIADILEMTIDDAILFFDSIPKIYYKIQTLYNVGLGYLSLGEQSTFLSGGEAQRIKLANELTKKQTGKTLYVLDEPTTGLHFDDIRLLMNVVQNIVDEGNTVIIIEHNLDVLKVCDHLIDIGPEGGEKGGQIIAEGSPRYITTISQSYTGKFLKSEIN